MNILQRDIRFLHEARASDRIAEAESSLPQPVPSRAGGAVGRPPTGASQTAACGFAIRNAIALRIAKPQAAVTACCFKEGAPSPEIVLICAPQPPPHLARFGSHA